MQPMRKNYKRDGLNITVRVYAEQPELMRLLIGWESDRRFLRREDVAWLADCLTIALREDRQPQDKMMQEHVHDIADVVTKHMKELIKRCNTLKAEPEPNVQVIAELEHEINWLGELWQRQALLPPFKEGYTEAQHIREVLDARVQRLRERKFNLQGMAEASIMHTPLGDMLTALYKAEKDSIEEEGRFLEQLYKVLTEEE